MSFVVTVALQAKPGAEANFLALVTENARRSLADEPGCRCFDVCTDPRAPGAIFLYEIYDGAAAFEAHKRTPHYLAFNAAAGPLTAEKAVKTFRLEERGR